MAESNALNATFKSMDTEEWLDIHFTRPLGLLWARLFNSFDVHPNVVTVLSIVLGVAAAVFFYFDSVWLNAVGILLLVWANIYDSCDGQMARMTGKKTRLGRVLDGFAGDVWFFSIYFAICMRLTPQEIPFIHVKWGVWIWLLCALAGFICHGKQCQLADYYRNIHLRFLKGEGGSELDRSVVLREEFRALPWRQDVVWKVFLYFYGNYTRGQELMTPRFQQLRAALDGRFGAALPDALRADFRAGSLPLMPLANILTFNTRAIVLYLSLLAGLPWVYPLVEITLLHALFLYMRRRHEGLCARLTANIDSYAPAV
ncbi:MAG: CDP-alcohol phosphatidyltransferase family protein [Prevotella sp.]|nr:CDP-alcohol phosphatidyltransferase family protein [Prevotella sp.]